MTILLIIGAVIVAVFLIRGASGVVATTTNQPYDHEGKRSIFDDDESMFDDSDSTGSSILDDDGPARGLWDPTSLYYDHSDHHTYDISSFDDSSSITSTSSSSFDD